MAYTPKVWKDGDVITKEALNNIEQGIVNVPAGLGIKGLTLTKDGDGKITGGTLTFSDDTTAAVPVTEA